LGAATTAIALVLVAVAVLRDELAALRASRMAGHFAVIGDTPSAHAFAERLAEAGERVLLVGAPGADEAGSTGRIARVGVPLDPAELPARTGLARARRVIVDLGCDADNLHLTSALASRLPDGPTIYCRVDDPLIARSADALFAGAPAHRPRALQEDAAVARGTLAREPLFALADLRGQARVHALLIGFGDLGEALFEAILLTSVAGTLKAPRITILAEDDEAVRQAVAARCPGLPEAAIVEVLPLSALPEAGAAEPLRRLDAIEEEDPFTAIFLCLGDEARRLRAAVLVAGHRERTGRFLAPVMLPTPPGESALAQPCGTGDLLDLGGARIAMARAEGVLLDEIRGGERHDEAARALHEAYAAGGYGPAPSWAGLPETLRRANRRAAAHVHAKLWTLGFDADRAEPGERPVVQAAERSALADLARAGDDPGSALARLASLEHDRWVTERVLDGWRPGPGFNHQRRIHPMLVPSARRVLSEAERRKDVDQVRAILDAAVASAPERGRRREVRIGIMAAGDEAGLDDPARAALAEALAATAGGPWAERGVALLGTFAPGRELALAEAAVDWLAARGQPVRLHVLAALPREAAIAEWFGTGADEARRRYEEALARLCARAERAFLVPIHPSGVVAADLGPRADAGERAGLRRRLDLRLSAYMARRPDCLMVAGAGLLPGPVADALAWRREPHRIPAEAGIPPSAQRPPEPPPTGSLALLGPVGAHSPGGPPG
ncbi:MAG TPA: RyR domain-containing protein, partial [Salinarimonas sp.]|nr:RyR domain-containing protein [Salinarimonas sp.]